ncbi:hypothetical protein JMA_03580 [Jeotgalibacillus malaysiensis]|uniref:Uncharacterized protein n=1 Tax=Jeotgalibacillus malaysiensis TaxID=1508404 RepID=A0A0B5AH24_9BACL|nr:hypothetical protein [Jeotgalibacillus malaysiensis]AJD89675.1 hypothetical protein JMA_03580 [Jeotgalibacillus malaysiensis]
MMNAVDVITFLIPIYYLAIIILSIVGIYFAVKVIKRYLRNGRLQEEKWASEREDIKHIRETLMKIEKHLSHQK